MSTSLMESAARRPGAVETIREERPLADVETAMEEILRGDVPARIVFRP